MIGCFNCPITGVRLQPTSRLQLSKMISEKNKPANAAITFEVIVMVMVLIIIFESVNRSI